mmetsp:Transcript_68947/g.162244  ORF Transcript_68947/g.162244 Transcript_68947/m.162244 type:complete len:201 (-) Transcript_68947:969-1571(-)
MKVTLPSFAGLSLSPDRNQTTRHRNWLFAPLWSWQLLMCRNLSPPTSHRGLQTCPPALPTPHSSSERCTTLWGRHRLRNRWASTNVWRRSRPDKTAGWSDSGYSQSSRPKPPPRPSYVERWKRQSDCGANRSDFDKRQRRREDVDRQKKHDCKRRGRDSTKRRLWPCARNGRPRRRHNKQICSRKKSRSKNGSGSWRMTG